MSYMEYGFMLFGQVMFGGMVGISLVELVDLLARKVARKKVQKGA